MNDLLIRVLGWRGALIHGDATVVDRWRHLARRLPRVRSTGERVLEIGCGTGAFTMGAASRGYEAVGLSWDERNQTVAMRRARLAGLGGISFPIGDARILETYKSFAGAFDVVICLEVIEHICDDRKLVRDIFGCLKPGGRLYLTTPNYHYRSSRHDMGPWRKVEDGGHVRRGYSPAMLAELCREAGLEVEEITYVSYFFSQLVMRLQMRLGHGFMRRLTINNSVRWFIALPLRILPPLFDDWLGRWLSGSFGYPGYSIALSAYKPRFVSAPITASNPTGSYVDIV